MGLTKAKASDPYLEIRFSLSLGALGWLCLFIHSKDARVTGVLVAQLLSHPTVPLVQHQQM